MKGNPYHDPKTGRFISGSGVNNSRDIDLRDTQIARNLQQITERRNREFTNDSLRLSQNAYDAMKSHLTSDLSASRDLDLEDTKGVVNYVRKFIRDNKMSINPACQATAGGVAAILKDRNIPYKCYIGICKTKNMKPEDNELLNHVWVESKDKIYEYFQGHETSDISVRKSRGTIYFEKGDEGKR